MTTKNQKNQLFFDSKKLIKSMQNPKENPPPIPKSCHSNFFSRLSFFHVFSVFLFQCFPFSRLSFSMFSFFKGMSMLLRRQLLQASSFSRTVYGYLFQDVRTAGKISTLFMRYFFPRPTFFKVIWGRQRKHDPFSRVNVCGCYVHPFSCEQEVEQHPVLRC